MIHPITVRTNVMFAAVLVSCVASESTATDKRGKNTPATAHSPRATVAYQAPASNNTHTNESRGGDPPEIRFFPIRTAPLGSPAGTVGVQLTTEFNDELGCWETFVPGGVEVDIDVQAMGWGNAVGSPTLTSITAAVDPSGYSNGVGGNLNPKGWPQSPFDGAYTTDNACTGDGSPCSNPPFDISCDNHNNGTCLRNPDWVMTPCTSGAPALFAGGLSYEWVAFTFGDCPVDDGMVKTVGGLILEVPQDAIGTYRIDLDPSSARTFMVSGMGVPIPGLTRTSACITIAPPCCFPDGSCTQVSPDECASGGGIKACECRGDDDMNGVNDACEADCDGDGILDIVALADCPPGDASCNDCNSTCIPDECELAGNDCNGNGIPDECDVAGNDCNGNGIPDECELAGNDCNGNGIPDECELAGNDCNDNGILDECDIDPSDPDGNGEVSGDMDGDGVMDECDNCPAIPNAGQEDRNADGIGDACSGACCFVLNGNFSCVDTTAAACAALPGVIGIFQGIGTTCPTEGVATNIHLGVVVTHVVDPAQLCGSGGRRDTCNPGDPIDPWQTAVDADICHQFGVGPQSPAIPADFFGPGSDPFTGQVCLEGKPLGPTPFGEFGEADTLVKRTGGPAGTGDPFDRCELPAANGVTVNAEVVALSLQSIAPIIVTFNGGQNPESWDVMVDLSTVTPPPGTITAVKTHCNGGTYNSELHVQPRFMFTKVDDPNDSQVLDTGEAGLPFVTLTQDTDPQWTSDVSETLGLPSPICTDFHPGIEDSAPTVDCDCNANQVRDVCEIESPSLPLPPHDILKNRYISVDPRGACGINAGKNLDIRLTLADTLVNGVTAIDSEWWANEPDEKCISIVGPSRPSVPPNWNACPTLHLTGCPIIPTSIYAIEIAVGELISSPPLIAGTQEKPGVKWHGDCVGFFTGTEWTAPNSQTSIDDAVAAIKTFQNPDRLPGCGTPPCNATHTSVTDMVPNLPGGPQINKIVNIADVFSIIQGFQGFEYPGPDLTQCQ